MSLRRTFQREWFHQRQNDMHTQRQMPWTHYDEILEFADTLKKDVYSSGKVNGWVAITLAVGDNEARHRAMATIQAIEFISALLITGVVSLMGTPMDLISELEADSPVKRAYYFTLVMYDHCSYFCIIPLYLTIRITFLCAMLTSRPTNSVCIRSWRASAHTSVAFCVAPCG